MRNLTLQHTGWRKKRGHPISLQIGYSKNSVTELRGNW